MTTSPLIVASSLPEALNTQIAAHPRVGRLIALTGAPWEVPPEADVLMTYQLQWKAAPESAPTGWPGGIGLLQIASAGLDTFPRWALDVPQVARGVGAQSPAIAEFVLASVMAHEKRLFDARSRSPEEWLKLSADLEQGTVQGKVLAIAGLGSIGQELAGMALAVGMEVVALRRRPGGTAPGGVRLVPDLRDLVAEADHLALCLPKTPQTIRCIDEKVLAAARPGMHVINIARGELIDDDALRAALESGRVSAATLDVTNPEPLPEGHPFWTHPRIRLTPHVSGRGDASKARIAALLLENIERFCTGAPLLGVVDREAGY